MSDFNAADYEETVESIAKEALQDYSGNSRDDFIRESVDGNSYIIYYAGAEVVKQASSNYGNDWREIHALAGDNADDDKLKQVAAYEAMIQDVYEWIRDHEDDYEDCEMCGKSFDLEENEGGPCYTCDGMFCNDCLTDHKGEDFCEACIEEAREEDPIREEDDGTITPSGPLGSRTSAAFGGKFIGEFSTDEEALEAIRKQGNEDQFFPNVCRISDHGNEHLITDFDWDQ